MNYSIIVVGAGSGGIVVAIGAAKGGKKVLLIERGNWGGDCTNSGCVPSKTLIAESLHPRAESLDHVREVVASVRVHEEPEALKAKGVDTLIGEAHFIDAHTLRVGDQIITADQIVIAAGSSPLMPNIEGLATVPYLTNETIFSLQKKPTHLCVIGGGPIGCELAQAFRRLGSKVSLIHRHSQLLNKEEPQAQAVIGNMLKKEGIELYLDQEISHVTHNGDFFTLSSPNLICSHLLVAVGRQPNVETLCLEAAGINFTQHGIIVDRYGRTNQKHIWAIGDVTDAQKFTHVAENQARSVLTSLFLPINVKLDTQSIPRVTYTDPEVASFGLLETTAAEKYGVENLLAIDVPMSENDRAITANRTEGFVKVITMRESSEILGATIVAPRAGEMLSELTLAKKEKIPLKNLAKLIHPYPTYSFAIRRAADLWYQEVFFPKLRHPFKGFHLKRYIPILCILVLMLVAYFTGVYEYFSYAALKEKHHLLKAFIAMHPIWSPIIFIALYIISTALSFPGGSALSLIAGFLFDVPLSTIYVVVGATIGACLIFLAARLAFVDILKRKAAPFLKKMEKGMKKNVWSYLLFLRFIPLFPFWLVNIAPAFFNVRLWTFCWTTFIGIIPGTYAFTQAGAGLSAIFEQGSEFSLDTVLNFELKIALVAIALVSLIPIFVKMIIAKRKKKIENP